MTSTEPELEMVRRGVWFAPPAFVLALTIGAATGGWAIGWSAAIGIAVVFVNFVVHGVSLARAAKRSLTALAAVAMGGFVVRMSAIVAIMFALNRLSFFSPLAFGLTVVPATVLLLVFEMKLLAGGLGSELRLPQKEAMTS
jgi:ATP synthase protein I